MGLTLAPTIKVLPETLANKIAAGEVVQRPASAVKELVENAIDAGAAFVTIIIKEGGKTLLQVVDDGSGMTPEDARLAFARHATSKIATYDDLVNIRTLGFRGEALASIAAVAQVELKTRLHHADVGTKVRIDGGSIEEVTQEAAAPGTSVLVRNLFYNTPARRNFLKSANTEYRHIFDVIVQQAISHPGIGFKFVSDDEPILTLRPEEFRERIRGVFGEKLGESMFHFREESETLGVEGFLSRPEFARKVRTEQYLFLNGRYIVSRAINHAVYQAYEHLLEKGTFPLFVLLLTLDPRRADVNVHPSKMEAKFEDESSVYRFVLGSVRKALSAHDLSPMIAVGGESAGGAQATLGGQQPGIAPRVRGWEELLRPAGPAEKATAAASLTDLPMAGSVAARNDLAPLSSQPEGQERPLKDRSPSVSLWQLHQKYIIVPVEGGVMIVDQHAAHERVLYERTIERFRQENTRSQQLLFPHTIQMTAGDAALIAQLLPALEELGFGVKLFGKTTVILDAVPIDVRPGDESTILQDVLDRFKEDEHEVTLEPRDRLAKSYSCKAAIKAGDPLKEEEMKSLLDQLFATETPAVCPHGRPVSIKLSLSDLDRRFGRTS